MRALDVMTSPVVTVSSNATVVEVARLFVERRISAAPVVDEHGAMVGVVSEGDLLHRAEIGTERRRSWWLDSISSSRDLAAEYVKSHSCKVSDVMTKAVISVDEATPISDIADILERKRIKRVPVLRDGKPVGVVSRANLVQALAAFAREPGRQSDASDQAIREHFLAGLKGQKWIGAVSTTVVVRDGVIHLRGDVASDRERQALHVAAENIPGVKAVEDHMFDTPLMPVG